MSIRNMLEATLKASKEVGQVGDRQISAIINAAADMVQRHAGVILAANATDLAKVEGEYALRDRLLLTEERLEGIASDLRKVASLPSPLGRILEERTLQSDLIVRKVTVPLGVVGVIYEARPNVTFDVFALCLKSGNAALLKGGSDAQRTNEVVVEMFKHLLQRHCVNPNVVNLLPPSRKATAELLTAVGYVDVIIPRGGHNLIDFVRKNASVPVIETGAGICHTYFDEAGDKLMGQAIVTNAKTRRVSVCNALDCLLIHRSRVNDLPFICEKLADKNVIIYADGEAYCALEGHYPVLLLSHAQPEHFGTEFLDYKLAIKTVGGFDEAAEHIARHSSKHSEAIVSDDGLAIEQFFAQVDAAVVYANASTAFTDGAQFGLGAEIGISTQKLHARGPMGPDALTTYKWLVTGNGQVRE